MTDDSTQLAVIGAGPGGYAAAFLAADMGMGVTLIDPEINPGGECLHRGCIPSKALLHVARLINETAAASAWGVSFGEPDIDIDRLRQWKTDVVGDLTGGLGRLVTQRGIVYERASASFRDARSLTLLDADGGTRRLEFEHAVLATGSAPVEIPLFADSGARIWNSASALDLPEIPSSLLVVGGGYIGLELGSVYASLGSQVTVVEMLPNLLAGADRDLVRVLRKSLENRFKAILLNTSITSATIQKNGIEVAFDEKTSGNASSQLFQRVLVAAGRRPRSSGLGLDKAGVDVRPDGFVQIDEQCRTSADTVFAIGDVAGQPMLAHKASYEARIAVETIAGQNVVVDPAAIPSVVFTDPEMAWTGLTENDARQRDLQVKTVRFPWAASGRAATLDRREGLTKLVIDPQTDRLLGIGIVGPGAGELIAEATLALEMGANATDLALTIHPHPTLSETLKEAADLFFGTATHYYQPRGKRKKADR